jgi:hypothetical protein
VALPDFAVREASNAVPPALFRKVMSRFATGVTVAITDHTVFTGRIRQLAVEEHAPLLFYGGRYAALDREQRLEQLGPQSFW